MKIADQASHAWVRLKWYAARRIEKRRIAAPINTPIPGLADHIIYFTFHAPYTKESHERITR